MVPGGDGGTGHGDMADDCQHLSAVQCHGLFVGCTRGVHPLHGSCFLADEVTSSDDSHCLAIRPVYTLAVVTSSGWPWRSWGSVWVWRVLM
jgi:hypothetical protein